MKWTFTMLYGLMFGFLVFFVSSYFKGSSLLMQAVIIVLGSFVIQYLVNVAEKYCFKRNGKD